MRNILKSKNEKAQFIINKLEWLKGLEFIDNDEIGACNLAIQVLKDFISKS